MDTRRLKQEKAHMHTREYTDICTEVDGASKGYTHISTETEENIG